MRLQIVSICSLLLLACMVKASDDELQGCKNVSISTQLLEDGEFSYDVMKKGERSSNWDADDETLKDSDSTELDFFYVTVFGKHDTLNSKNFQISTSSQMASNTTIFLEKVVDRVENKTYSIRINYKCNENLADTMKLNFKVLGNFPGCKMNSDVFWVRKCGDNEPPRMGLSVDYNIKNKKNRTIVENGRIFDADFYSEDYDAYILTIPQRVQYSLFYIQLNVSEEIYKHNDMTLEDVDKLFKKDKLLTHELQFQKSLEVKRVSLNYDVQILDIVVKSPILDGGVVTFEREPIYLEYTCKRGGTAQVQLTIEMDYFKNVNIYFEKECPASPSESGGFFGSFSFFMMIFLIVIALVTFYNVFALEIRGVKAVPFAVFILTGISKAPLIKGTSVGDSIYNFANPSHTNTLSNSTMNKLSNKDEQEFKESEFRIKNFTKDVESNLDDSTVGQSNTNQLGNYGSI